MTIYHDACLKTFISLCDIFVRQHLLITVLSAKMPCLNIVTNVPKSKIPKDFVDRFIPILSKSVGKPEEVFICAITGDAQLHMFGDSKSPGAVASLESIGNLGPQENQVISRQLSEYMKREIGVEPGRFFLSFYDLETHNVGIKGTTVQFLD